MTGVQTCALPICEFIGLSYYQQYLLIKKGKEYLEKELGINIYTFIPPWNTYDKNTLRVLEKLNFANISNALNNKMPTIISDINYYPFTSSLKDFNLLCGSNKKSNSINAIVLFHAYDFCENKEFYNNDYIYKISNKCYYNLNNMERLLIKIKCESKLFADIQNSHKFNYKV